MGKGKQVGPRVGPRVGPQVGPQVGLGRPGAAERVEIGTSPIHGSGLFAARRIRTGAYVATFEGKITKRDGMHVLWTFDEDGNEYGIEGRNALRFLNHSPDPNAEFIGRDLHAVRNVQSGTELTIDYGEEWERLE
ncbi:MAG: SET domain-containing protein-lysine N-methyltransferase [Deltaproteobacteria bacterium]|nr:SET domain-containing protein-lysine N-methyltransferase [Deltaproteobacteria bacterium]